MANLITKRNVEIYVVRRQKTTYGPRYRLFTSASDGYLDTGENTTAAYALSEFYPYVDSDRDRITVYKADEITFTPGGMIKSMGHVSMTEVSPKALKTHLAQMHISPKR